MTTTVLEAQLQRSVDTVDEHRRKAALARVEQAAPLARSDFMSEWSALMEQARVLVRSGFLPRAVDTPEKAVAIIQTGRELGLGPMQSLRMIHIVDGKPTMAAELMAGLVLSKLSGAVLRVHETTERVCEVHAARPGQPVTTYRFTIEDAQKAGLTGKQNWRNYPRAMLRNRCIAEAARGTFPDCSAGLYDPDELGAITTTSGELAQEPPQWGAQKPVSVAEVVYGEELPPEDATEPNPFAGLKADLQSHETRIATALNPTNPDQALTDEQERLLAIEIRHDMGSKANPRGRIAAMVQTAKERRTITPQEYKELSKDWARVDRQLAKLEARVKPVDVTESFRDDDEREPGSDG